MKQQNAPTSYDPLYVKPSVMDKISKGIKRIININTLAVIIAFLQLLIAYPTLKMMTMSKYDKISQTTNRFAEQLKNMEFLSIPDSLLNDDIRTAQQLQKEIYALSLVVANTEWDLVNKEVYRAQCFYLVCLLSKCNDVYASYGRQIFSSLEQKNVRNSYLFLANNLDLNAPFAGFERRNIDKDLPSLIEKTVESSYRVLVFLTEIQLQNLPGINLYNVNKDVKALFTSEVEQIILR